jgi:hypothetical protein
VDPTRRRSRTRSRHQDRLSTRTRDRYYERAIPSNRVARNAGSAVRVGALQPANTERVRAVSVALRTWWMIPMLVRDTLISWRASACARELGRSVVRGLLLSRIVAFRRGPHRAAGDDRPDHSKTPDERPGAITLLLRGAGTP